MLLLNKPCGAAPHPVCPWLSPSICPFSSPRTYCSPASPAPCPSIPSPVHPTVFSLSQRSTHLPVHLPAFSSERPHLSPTHPPARPSVCPPRTAHPFSFWCYLSEIMPTMTKLINGSQTSLIPLPRKRQPWESAGAHIDSV